MTEEYNSSKDHALNLGQLEEVDLRKIWEKEADHFSTWLANEGMPLLSEAIGIDIQEAKREASTGSFFVDILAEEPGTGKKIIIENQLEKTDHDHLGKIVTYAAGHDASIIILIFKEMREEHRSAIDWLNDITTEGVSFFALKINLYKIDDSRPAPKFEIVCKPNEWNKKIKGGDKIISTTNAKYGEFWEYLKNCARNQTIKNESGKLLFNQNPRPQHWYTIAVGTSYARIELTVSSQKNDMCCQLVIDDEGFYCFLEEHKVSIQKNLGETKWRKKNQSWAIEHREESFDLYNYAEYDEYCDWFIKQAELFYKTFTPYIGEYKKQPSPQYED